MKVDYICNFVANFDRNIYYQNMELFRSQSVVDEMVDNLAFTLGVGRNDLNIVRIRHFSGQSPPFMMLIVFQVATAKGLVAGQVELIMRGGSRINCAEISDSVSISDRLAALLTDCFRVFCCHQSAQLRRSTFSPSNGYWSLKRRHDFSHMCIFLSRLFH